MQLCGPMACVASPSFSVGALLVSHAEGAKKLKRTKEDVFFPDDHPNVKRELERVLKESSRRRGSETRGDAKWTKIHSGMAESCHWAQRPCGGVSQYHKHKDIKT